VGKERWCGGGLLGALLGPEGVAVAMISGDLTVGRTAGIVVAVLDVCCPGGCGGVGWRRCVVGGLPFLENCTVDASIFIFASIL